MIKSLLLTAPRALCVLALSLGLAACGGEAPTASDPVPAVNTDACIESFAVGFQADKCLMANGDNPPISPLYWPDVCTPNLQGWTPVQGSFDQLSWRSFLYNNWPADGSGQPDTNQQIGVQVGGVYPDMVWQKYKNAQDVIGTGSEEVAAYASPSPVPEGCDPAGPRVLTMTSKFPTNSIASVRSALLEGTEDGASLSSIDQAFRGPLYPQGPDPLLPVFYEIRINETEYNAIVSAGAQDKSPAELNCTSLAVLDQDSPCVPFSFPLESTEVKAAWKELSGDEKSSGTFFHQDLQVVDPSDGTCSVRTMGLVGLHIARKVSHAVPAEDARTISWAWSTFEHANNVPPVASDSSDASDGSEGSYSFFSSDCTPAVDDATCAALDPHTAHPEEKYQCCPNLYRYAAGTVPANPTPDQVTRIDASPTDTQACDAVYDPLDKGVFNNYSLVVTQWPKAADGPPFTPIITPALARNAVIETYFAKWQNGEQVSTSSCMGCHGGSSAVDMSYIFLPNSGN